MKVLQIPIQKQIFYYYYYTLEMKSIKIQAITQKGSVLFQDSGSYRESTLQGFTINTNFRCRLALLNKFNQNISCSLSKTSKIRLSDLETVKNMLSRGIIKINEVQFEQSKVYTSQQKSELISQFQHYLKNKQSIQTEQSKNILDFTQNNGQIPEWSKTLRQLQCNFVYVGQQIIIKFAKDDKIGFTAIKLQNINHYLMLIDPKLSSKIFSPQKTIKIIINQTYFNLAKKKYEIEVTLPDEIQEGMMKNGWGTLNLKNINKMKPQKTFKLKQAEKKARLSHIGIFKKPFEILSLIYTKNNMIGVIEEIVEGYIFKIRNKKQQSKKVQLTNIYCPVQSQPGAYQSREFARKNLLGKQVNIFMKNDNQFVIQASIVRIADNKDVQVLMIEHGFGLVRQELRGTMMVNKLQALQKKTKSLRKGIHDQKNIGTVLFEDLTVPYSKKTKLQKKSAIEKRIKYLQQVEQEVQGIIEKITNSTNYIIRIPSNHKLIKVKLDGVSNLTANPRLPEIIEIKQYSDKFCYRNFYQRTVNLQINDFDQATNKFIGEISLKIRGTQASLQKILLQEGLVYLNDAYNSLLIDVQQNAQNSQKNIWKPHMKALVRNDLLNSCPNKFIGRLSWVQNGQLAYVQPESIYQKLDYIYQQMNEKDLPNIKEADRIFGYLCGSKFQGQICRARIISNNQKNVTVLYIDWGNKQTVQAINLFELPNQLQYIPPLCCEIKLDLVQPLKLSRINRDHLEKVRQIMTQDEVQIQKIYGNIVNLYTKEKKQHLNYSLIEQGYLKADLSKIPNEEYKQNLSNMMEKLRKELVGIWEDDEYSDQQLQAQYQYDM